MALIESELKIIKVSKLLEFGQLLKIPKYQRPYKWSKSSVNTLFDDINFARKNNREIEYRVGTIILCKENDQKYYDIVDGQQRITTLSLLLKCLKSDKDFGNLEYFPLSIKNIKENYQLLKIKVSELSTDEEKDYLNFLLNKCEFVKIVTNKKGEAFQFFDSQNSRGKELAPHDLLKAYHLREMHNDSELVKKEIVDNWERQKEVVLKKLFSEHLYPLNKWYQNECGLYYSSSKIKQFKGLKYDYNYNYVLYHKASNLFIENMNSSTNIFSQKTLNEFQLTQPIIAGKRFFLYVSNYLDLLEKVKKLINNKRDKYPILENGKGDYYTLLLLQNTLMFFADKFSISEITESIYKKIYLWSYTIRISMYRIYPETIDKFARGKSDRVEEAMNLFAKINKMMMFQNSEKLS